MRTLTTLILSLLTIVTAQSQDLVMDAHVGDKEIIMRWAPVSMETFKEGINHGYVIERVFQDGNQFEVLDTIHHATESEAKTIINQNPKDDAATIAAYYLYSEESKKNTSGFANIFEGYSNYNDEQMSHNFMLTAADLSSKASIILGLRYVIKDYDTRQKAIYRLRCLSTQKVQSASYYYTGEKSYYPKIEPVGMKQSGKLVELTWDNITYQKYYTGYDVLRSSTLNGTFTKRNVAPIYLADADAEEVIFKDSVEIGQTYFYKVQGHTAFDIKGPISEIFEIKTLNSTVAYKAIGMKARGNHESIKLEWTPIFENPTAIKSVILLKANAWDGPYEVLSRISASTTTYTDRKINGERVHFYRIAAENKDGFWYYSNPTRAVYVDEIPPETPIELVGAIDSNGVCYIHWKATDAADLKGYRVYKSNRKDGTYYHAHDLLNTTNTFIDTVGIQYLSEELYYKIVAVDFDNNHSDYSSLLTVKRPDLVPPVAAQIYDYEIDNQGLKIYIHNSPSKDVKLSYIVKTHDEIQEEVEIDSGQGFYIDQEYEEGQKVTYQLRTIDDAENSVLSRPVTIQSRNTKSILQALEAEYAKGEIVINWASPDKVKGMIIFYLQEEETQEFQFLSKLSSIKNSFSSSWPNKGKYTIAAVFQSDNGKQYPPIFSNPIIIE